MVEGSAAIPAGAPLAEESLERRRSVNCWKGDIHAWTVIGGGAA